MDKTLCSRLESAIHAELEEIAEAAEHRKDGMSRQMICNMHDLLECIGAVRMMKTDAVK